jgi:polyphosphate kinase 2 (PPK2 family)
MKASVCKRLLARLDEPGKRWKFSTADFTERGSPATRSRNSKKWNARSRRKGPAARRSD